MKIQILTILVLNLVFASFSFGGANLERGVQTSSDKEIRKAASKPNTAGASEYDNSPTQINKQRMEANPSGTSSDPTKWPHGSAMESVDDKIQD